MIKLILSFTCFSLLLFAGTQDCLAQDPAAMVTKLQERYTLSLALEFTRKNENPLERTVSVLFGDPNGYATGFLVGDGLVMTAYHVVSGELSISKKMNMGFKPADQLSVRIFVNGCRATVLKVDKEADLALLEVCGSRKDAKPPAFQVTPTINEQLLLIARPRGSKMISKGYFSGPYVFRGLEFWSAKLDGRDGFSGSPVYNHHAEIVGVFSGYDWNQHIALISPGVRAQKLLAEYLADVRP